MILSKPHVTGQLRSSEDWHGDEIGLFSSWNVSWDELAACGHDKCGIDWYDKSFATWDEAVKFAVELGWSDLTHKNE